MKRTLIVLVTLAMLAGGAAAATIEREIAVGSGGLIEFDLKTGGTVNITGWGSSTVAVTVDVSGGAADAVRVEVEGTGEGVLVTSRYAERRQGMSAHITIDVKVPSVFDVRLDSQGGGLSIDGVEGTFSGKTMGGALSFTNIKGLLALKTMGGRITLTDSDVDGKVKTMGGRVLVENVFGDVEATSMGGPVTLRNVTRSDGSSTGDQVIITSMGGSIDVPEAPAGADVHTMGGDITIESAAEFVKAKTMGGDIHVREVDGRVTATTMGGDVDVTVISRASSGADIELTSMSGEIVLTVPDDFAMEIDIELAYTKNSSRSYQIVSDFPLAQRESPDWDYSKGSPRKTISATGSNGGGGNRVVIRTVNGDVHLKHGR